ncbi:MAG TPA: helix-hairpin-helix domain-containing protein [Acidobacteria bacterium]|nr:helix-hairpin-helix domain-containing protein [Acidobacteriota bacterium]
MQRMMWVMALVAVLGVGSATTGSAQQAAAPAGQTATQDPVDLNRATSVQLETLPGVGPRTAERIIEYRRDNGGFEKIEDLMNVRGIGERSFLKLRPLVTVDAATSGASEDR